MLSFGGGLELGDEAIASPFATVERILQKNSLALRLQLWSCPNFFTV